MAKIIHFDGFSIWKQRLTVFARIFSIISVNIRYIVELNLSALFS